MPGLSFDAVGYNPNYQSVFAPKQQAVQTAPQSKAGGWKALAASLLPTVGGAIGAVGGSFVAPVAGTVAGGAAGSAFGEALRQRITGEHTNLKDIGIQAGLGAVPGVLKGAKAGVTALRTGKAARTAQEAEAVARQGSAATNLGTLGVGAEAQAGRDAAARQIADAQQYNSLAKQNVQNLAQKSATQGLPLGSSGQGGVLVKPGATPSLASEGVNLKPVPDLPYTPDRALTPRPQADPNRAIPTAKPTLFSKIKGSASQANGESKGVVVGANAGRGKVVTPDEAAKLNDFIDNRAQIYGGIRSGRPIDQANDAQGVFNNVKKALDDTLNKIDRPLQPHEPINIGANAVSKVRENTAVTGTTKTLDQFTPKIENAKTVKELEKIRREADDLAFTQSGAGKTSAAAQARGVRDAIDEFITPLSAEYKAVKGDYPLARDALQATSKASNEATGFKPPFTDIEIGKQALPGVKNKASAIFAGKPISGTAPAEPTIKKQVGKSLFNQIATRAVATPLTTQSDNSQSTTPTTTTTPTTINNNDIPQLNPQTGQSTSTGGIPHAAIDQAIQQALAKGDTKGLGNLLSVAAYYQKKEASASKPLNSTQQQQANNAMSGLAALQKINDIVTSDPSAVLKSSVPTNIGKNLAGGAVLHTAIGEAADVISRLRTGAAINKEEETFYRSKLPSLGDSNEVIQYKLGVLNDLFSKFANPAGAGGDITTALQGAQ